MTSVINLTKTQKAILVAHCSKCNKDISIENGACVLCVKQCNLVIYCSDLCCKEDKTEHQKICSTTKPSVPVNFMWKGGGKEVVLYCSEDNYKPHALGPLVRFLTTDSVTSGKQEPTKVEEKGVVVRSVMTNMLPGRYFYRFKVDGEWKCGPQATVKENGNEYNVIYIQALTEIEKAHVFFKQWFRYRGPEEIRDMPFSVFWGNNLWKMMAPQGDTDAFFWRCVHHGNVNLLDLYQHETRKEVKPGMVIKFV